MAAATANQLWPSNRHQNLYQSEAASLLADLAHKGEDLFTEDESDLLVTITEQKGHLVYRSLKCTTSEHIQRYIQTPGERGITTIIQIHQPFSWAELAISKDAAQALFTHLDVSPGFWAVMKLFGSKANGEHELVGGFNEGVQSDDDQSFEISYTAKHVEEHGRQGVHDPWSIRQLGVYCKYDATNDQTVFILLNPSKSLTRRLEEKNFDGGALGIHRLIQCAIAERWTDYLTHLESQCKDISQKAILANDHRSTSRGFTVHFSDAQLIHNLQDKIIRTWHVLDLNLDIFENILAWPGLVQEVETSHVLASSNRAILSSITTLFAHKRKWKRQVETLLRRLDGSSLLVRSILDATALETLQKSSQTTAELATLAREDGQKATQDARTLKTISILGFVYLPASFVATLLGTQYITIHDEMTGKISLIFARELWIFAILTVILLAATVGTWLWWERHNRLADRAAFERSEKIE